MITREDLDRAYRCTAGADCPVHRIDGIHDPLIGIHIENELREWVDVAEAIERHISESWDGETSLGDIAVRWIGHMATTHGAHCAGPHCTATADTPAYAGALRRMWRDSETLIADYRDAIRDLAHELGVDLDTP